ncbi:FAD-dependent oxidoreductase [Nocardia sp. NBC_00511]|uniref:FAD-dependent oxidoreductase n=1 Tax=Nocardia sp. NBC_00511 TaxID=2903591 RepID=UPI0030DE7B8D
MAYVITRPGCKLRVAIVGSGPAGCYAARELLAHDAAVEVEMFERLPAPWGLLRSGVAPDRPDTKQLTEVFDRVLDTDALAMHLNVAVGEHIRLPELLAHHHAVVYATGAAADRRLGIPGEWLPGSHSAAEFIGWYNGHPDYADHHFDLSGERAVVVGNGNSALDVARILTADPRRLAATDIAEHALDALRHSRIREVVVLGRRSPLQAAYTGLELLALGRQPGVDVIVDEHDLELDVIARAVLEDPGVDPVLRLKWELAVEYARRDRVPAHRRILLNFLATPVALHGRTRVTGITFARNEIGYSAGEPVARRTPHADVLDTSLVLRAVGHHGQPIPDLPFDPSVGVVPNARGRVLAKTGPMPGVYVTGWIKRGPHGDLDSHRLDARETVEQLLDDFHGDRLPQPGGGRSELLDLLTRRCPDRIDRTGWLALDAAEREAGLASGRPRVKFTALEDCLRAARRAPAGTP